MSNKKKILFLYARNPSELHNRKSALGSYFKELAKLLEPHFEVSLNGEFGVEDQQDKSDAKEVSNSNFLKRFLITILSLVKFKEILQFLNYKKQHKALLNHLSNRSYDVIFEICTIYSDLGYTLSIKQGIPLITLYDGPVLEEYEFFNGKLFFTKHIAEQAHSNVLKTSKNIVAYSDAVKLFLFQQHNISQEKIMLHQNVDFSRFRIYETDKIKTEINVLFMGSFLKWHKAENIIWAFKNLDLNLANVKVNLFMVGDGQERAKIQAKCESEKLKNIHFTGFIDGDELESIKQKCHIGIMPSSNWYGAPNKIFEYAAAGLLVIGPITLTITNIFNGMSGMEFIENGSKEELLKKLQLTVNNPELAVKNAVEFQQFILSKYTIENTSVFYTNLFENSVE